MKAAVSNPENIYCFDDVTVEGVNFRVRKNGREIALTPRAFDVLFFLIQNGGRVVEKQEIFEFVWKDAFVSDNSLTKIIKEIRHALEDSADKPHYIETVPKRGYRFIGKIKRKNDDVPPEIENTPAEAIIIGHKIETGENDTQPFRQKTSPRSIFSKAVIVVLIAALISISALVSWSLIRKKPVNASLSPIQSIAVLPFKPLNADSRDESLEMGMSETLITRLSNLRQIAVRPMSAVRKYASLQQDPIKAGQEIKVEAVLDGSIQKAGERVRVTVRLIKVSDGAALWAEQFDENFTDIFKVQDSIAERVTKALELELSKQEKERLALHLTDNSDAYQLYLRGQLIWHTRRQDWIEQSLAYYQQALEKDPDFALAHIGVAECYMMLSGHRKMSKQDAGVKAKSAILKALKIDDSLAQAHNALAEFRYQFEYDWAGAEKEFQRAIELNPNIAWIRQAYGWFLMSAGRFDEAALEMNKAGELDPSSLTIRAGRGRLYYFSRQYDKALEHFHNIIAVEPSDSSAYYALYTIYEQKQMYREALEAWLKCTTLNGMPTQRAEEIRQIFNANGWEELQLKHLERMEEKARTEKVNPFWLANLYVRLGRKEEAFVWFEKTFEAHDVYILQFKIEPGYDILRDDPRYAKLLGRIGLQP